MKKTPKNKDRRKKMIVRVLPYDDGTKYKNGKPKTKWVVSINGKTVKK